MPHDPIQTVLKTIRHYRMLGDGAVLIAVSGGPDSVFLLHALQLLAKKTPCSALAICHLDHGLRAGASADDCLFVRRLAAAYGIPCIWRRVDIAARRRKGMSTEEAAREIRYRFFREAAAACGAHTVATGHTLDDQAETIMMRIVRGAALKGVVGIAPVRVEGDLTYIRPLLELTKADIAAYLDRAGIDYRTDQTNAEPIYFRNVVRREIIPFLERYNPRLKRALSRMAEHLREDFEFIEGERIKKHALIGLTGDGGVSLKLKDIVVQPRALQKEILRDGLRQAGGDIKKLSFRHWKDVEDLIMHKRTGNAVDLPGSIRLLRTATDLLFVRV